MNHQEFIMELKKRGIDLSIVVFDNNIKDGFCIRKNYFRWEICYRERGQEYNIRGYPSEGDALEMLLEEIIRYNDVVNSNLEKQKTVKKVNEMF